MSKAQTTPFERAISAWILALPGTWRRVCWKDLTHTDEKALNRLVMGGFVEARLPVTLKVNGENNLLKTVWRITGNYNSVLGECVRHYLAARGHTAKETGIICGEYEEVRLTAEGELAKQDFKGTVVTESAFSSDGSIKEKREPGVDYYIFSLVSGGPNGMGGVKPKGIVYLDSELPELPPVEARPEIRRGRMKSARTRTMPESILASKRRKFAVAFSFPGERRGYVKAVDEVLTRNLIANEVFYDDRFKAELARPDLDAHLQQIYHDDTELIVVFLSQEYETKEWCGLEWRGIRDLIKKRRRDDIMFFRFDDAQITGSFSIDGYVDARKESPEQAAALILKRLTHNRQPPRC